MTAVNPNRLQGQIQSLLTHVNDPKVFHRELHNFFSIYDLPSFRFGELSSTKPLIPMFNPPALVRRQLEIELLPWIKNQPELALKLAEELWHDEYFEVLQLAIFIVGNTPIEDPQRRCERLSNMVNPNLDPSLSSYLFSVGANTLQTNFPIIWESFIQSYVSSENPKLVNLGLQGLAEGLKNTSFPNLPAVFRLISPILQTPKSENIRALERLLEVLVSEHPEETVYFLRQTLSITNNAPETVRLVKSVTKSLPAHLQEELTSAMK
jgi:hypothetical protein